MIFFWLFLHLFRNPADFEAADARGHAGALLDRAGTPVLGVVLNRTPVNQLNSYYKQYSAYYSG